MGVPEGKAWHPLLYFGLESKVMLRTQEQRDQRAEEMLVRRHAALAFEEEHGELLSLAEAAAVLKVSRETARRLLRNEPGVHLLRTPGSSRPTIRVPRDVVERVLCRSANR
jgi:hypothetical protein